MQPGRKGALKRTLSARPAAAESGRLADAVKPRNRLTIAVYEERLGPARQCLGSSSAILAGGSLRQIKRLHCVEEIIVVCGWSDEGDCERTSPRA
jgi:hypothetical protein